MKQLFFLVPVVMVFSACSSSSERGATVTADIKGLEAGQLVNYAPESDLTKQESVPAEAGKFTFTIPVQAGQGDWYKVWIGGSPSPSKEASLYLDSGDVHITAAGGGFADATYSGCATAVEYNELLHAVKDAGQDGAAAIGHWVVQHPASPLSTALIHKYKSGAIHPDTAITYFSRLTPSALNNIPAQKIREWMIDDADIMPGKPAPAFIQPDTSGKPVALKEYKGKYVLVDFWASWCGPCRAENPNVLKAYTRFKDKGFNILGVSLDEASANWLTAIHKDQLPWAQVSDLKAWDNTAAKSYHVKGIPANFLVNPDGVIIARALRGEALEKKLEEVFEH